MAEGGDFGYEDHDLDYQIDHDDDDDDQEVNRTQPFRPGAASTPYHGGERHEMQTMHEQSGLPSYDEETPLISEGAPDKDLERRLRNLRNENIETRLHNSRTGLLDTTKINPRENPLSQEDKAKEIEKVKSFIKARYPNGRTDDLKFSFSKKKNPMDIVVLGPKGGEVKVLLNDGSGLQKSFLNTAYIKKALGRRAEEIIAQDRNTIQEQRQRLLETERQQREAEIISAQRDEESQEIQNLRSRTERVQAQIDTIQEEQGSNLESETELNRLKQLKKNYEKDLEIKKKKLGALEKEAKNKDKAQEKINRERAKLAQIEKYRNEIEERLNNTKSLDELKEQESELKRQNEEDQAIVQDDNTSPSEREAADARVAERNEELSRLRTQIE